MLLLLLALQQPDALTGTWTGTASGMGRTEEFTLRLQHIDGTVTGTMSVATSREREVKGTYDASTKRLTLSGSIGEKIRGQTVTIDLTVEGSLVAEDSLGGSVTARVPVFPLPVKGTFEARRAPEAPAEPVPDDPHVAAILRLRFDRRPSTILKAKLSEAPADEIERFGRHVTLGRWDDVRAFLATLPEANRDAVYQHLLESLLTPFAPEMEAPKPWLPPPEMPPPPEFAEKNALRPEDVFSLVDLSPVALEGETFLKLGALLKRSLDEGYVLDAMLARMEARPDRIASARLLQAAGLAVESGRFLPATSDDPLTLDLIALHLIALHEEDSAAEPLRRAWEATLALLAIETAPDAAVERALELSTRVRESLGEAWLRESFTAQPERGYRILATIGSLLSRERHEQDAERRRRRIELQSHAVEALLSHAPERAEAWAETLDLLAANWVREAEYSREYDAAQSLDPEYQFDRYGNLYFDDDASMGAAGGPPTIPAGRLLDARPGEAWLARVRADLRPRIETLCAQLYLKVNEPERAFPFIEAMAATRPEAALELADEFITVWTANHDPNREASRTNRYMYFYGYNPRASGIPLTRSKQARNLEELGEWVRRLRGLPIGGLDEKRLSQAFVTSHSIAEVYRLEDLERVFGAVDTLEAETLAELIQTMRRNLAGVWRDPRTQQEQQTKRKDKEIEREVFRGYDVARAVLDRAVEKYPDSWAIHLARAAIQFDENTFRFELTQSPQFATRRDEAFALFAAAAERYRQAAPPEDEETAEAYEMWFYAALGATDLGGLKAEHPPDPRQPPRIREAILALGEPAAERHLARFANALSTRMTAVKPELKQRYLKHGLTIAGDHKQARESRKLFEYYDDLVTEVRIEVAVDGTDRVGAAAPFGVFVSIRHTPEIERESGGFQKYLQNQNNQPYFWNFGRPPENYRDKFEETARKALADSFEVLSVTFHADKIESRGDPEAGWRRTPYAYLLLRAKGPEVDEIPPLHLDLDFLDTSGFCVLPIESARVPLDAAVADPRPADEVKIVQTLDERKADEGRLILEVRASAHGLVPALDELLKIEPAGFEVARTDDRGVAVARLDPESEENAAISERDWLIELRAKDGAHVESFRFAAPVWDGAEVTYQRYEDADLVEVPAEVALTGRYGDAGWPWPWAIALLVAAAIAATVYRLRPKKRAAAVAAYAVPAELTPFSVLGLLRRIRDDGRLGADARPALDAAIARIEQHFFNRGAGEAPDLGGIVDEWVGRAG